MDAGHDQWAGLSPVYRLTEAGDEEALNKAIPGASFDWMAESGSSFTARYRHLELDGVVVTHLALDQPSYVTLGERIPGFAIWHGIGPRAIANGNEAGPDQLVLVRPGEGATLRTGAPVGIQSFALQPGVFAGVLERPAGFPFGPEPLPAGRWQIGAGGARQRALARHRAVLEEVGARPALLEAPAARVALRNALLDAVMVLGEAGAFAPDRAATGRHTRIMLRFDEIVREAADEALGLEEICRRVGASRRALTAIVLERTGRAPWEYLRWRRLWLARARLSRPAPGASVTDVAFSLGFWHLGRFAAAYAGVFGERPGQTLARAMGVREAAAPGSFAQNG